MKRPTGPLCDGCRQPIVSCSSGCVVKLVGGPSAWVVPPKLALGATLGLERRRMLDWDRLINRAGVFVNRAALLRSALVALLRNKMRSVLTVLGITIGIAAVICVVAIGKAGQARVE